LDLLGHIPQLEAYSEQVLSQETRQKVPFADLFGHGTTSPTYQWQVEGHDT
jgi:hypothetical protein